MSHRLSLFPFVVLVAALAGCAEPEAEAADVIAPSDTTVVPAEGPARPAQTAPQTTPSSSPRPTPAEPAGDDGVTRVAAESGLSEEVLDRKGEWTIYAGMDATGSDLRYCVAERNVDGNVVRIGTDGETWQLAVHAGAELSSGLRVDDRPLRLSGPTANGWTFGWLSLDDLGVVAETRWLEVYRGEFPVQHDLSAVGPAIESVESCATELYM